MMLPAGQTASLEVKVNNIKSQKGSIRVGLFTNEKDFLKNAIDGKGGESLRAMRLQCMFENLKPGDYAIECYP